MRITGNQTLCRFGTAKHPRPTGEAKKPLDLPPGSPSDNPDKPERPWDLLKARLPYARKCVAQLPAYVRSRLTSSNEYRTLKNRPALPGKHPEGSARAVAQRLQGYRFLHALDSPEKLKIFLKRKDMSAADLDLRWDSARQRLVVSHEAVTLDSPDFKSWLGRFLSLPVEKAGAIKLDIKEAAAIEPLIKELKEIRDEHPQLAERVLIINSDIPLGASHAKSRIRLADMQRLRQAFPEAVISLGVQAKVPEADEALLQDAVEAVKSLGGVNTIVFHVTTRLSDGVFERLEAENAFVTIWANKLHRQRISGKSFNIPKDRYSQAVLDF